VLKVEFVKQEINGKITTQLFLNFQDRRLNRLNLNYSDLQVINGLISDEDYSEQ
jgi:hypothetical protein